MRIIKSETYFPIIVGVHLILWAVDLSLYEGSPVLVEGESPTQRVLGEIMSSWVMTVFGFNLLMVTRARWVERVFGGLDKMYLIHRRSGVIAAVLLLLHFGTVPRYPEFSIGKPMGFAAMTLILLGIAFAAAPLMKRKIPYRKWVGGHRLMGPFYVVGIAHALFVPTLISHLPLVRTYVFGMAILGVFSWVYRAFLFRLLRPRLTYRTTAVNRFGGGAVDLRMAPDGERLEHDAGQFAFFSFEGFSGSESHPFTIASAPEDKELRIVVRSNGDFTDELVEKVEVGAKVRVEGPYGHLTRRHVGVGNQVWIAGGIGITPFLSLARTVSAAKARLIWSVRSHDEAFSNDELAELARDHEAFEYELWTSGEQGHLSVAGAGGVEAFRDREVVICGPASLRDGLTSQLEKAGVRSGRIHSEEFDFR